MKAGFRFSIRPADLFEIVARRAVLNELGTKTHIAIAFVFHELIHDKVGGPQRQRHSPSSYPYTLGRNRRDR